VSNSLLVIASANERNGLLDKMESQLARADIEFYLNVLPDLSWRIIICLEFRLKILESMATLFKSRDKLIFVDAWDMLFYGTKEEVLDKVWGRYTPIIAMEKNCFPDLGVSNFFPNLLNVPWKFINGGGLAGSPEQILWAVKEIRKHPGYEPKMVDQEFYNLLLLTRSLPFQCDYRTSLFYCMFKDQGELIVNDGERRPFNQVTGTYPNFIHFNGKEDYHIFLKMVEGE
jgi:hypothetical protein